MVLIFMFTSVKLAFKGCQWTPLNANLTHPLYQILDVFVLYVGNLAFVINRQKDYV